AYFANPRSAEAVVGALLQPQPTGFRPIGPLSWSGDDASGVRATRDSGAAAPGQPPAHERPAVFVLPGILGSHLKVGDQRVWLSLRLVGGLQRLAWQADGADGVTPDGPIGIVYDALIEHLRATHEVIPFGFDWRRPLEDEAVRLADAVSAALDARVASGQPVRLLAHSMGGLLARTLQLERPAVWQRLMDHEGARLVMLGTPNGGSWAPMQVLSGDDRFGNALAAFGAPFQEQAGRQLMAGMPGFLQLQAALPDAAHGLALESTWRRLADDDLRRVQQAAWWHHNVFPDSRPDLQLTAYEWGVPSQAVLDRALALRRRLDEQREHALPAWTGRLRLVVGHASRTPDGWEWSEEGLVYLDAVDAGDGRVPLDSALLPGVPTWTLDAEHGSLPDTRDAFDAYVELLERGDTERLARFEPPPTRAGTAAAAGAPEAAAVHVRSRPSRGRASVTAPVDSMKALLSAVPPSRLPPATGTTGTALRVTVLNGDLKFVAHALLLGHYRASRLTGTEGVVDRMLDGLMSASLDAGLYPDAPGTHQIFLNAVRDPDNPWRAPHPEAVIVVGLGPEGDLTPRALTLSVRQGVLAWSQRRAENPYGSAVVTELASTLIGSGGLGISPGAAACAIAQGVREANERLAAAGWPVVSGLWLVELFLERAAEGWRSLQVQATATPGRYDIAPTIVSGTGPLRRQLDSAYRGTDYDLITAETQADDRGDQSGRIAFRLDTRRARTEVRAQMTQARLVRSLVTHAANDANTDPQLGRTLFQLLVPPEVEPFLGGTDQMLLELDAGTAGIPWELLDTPPEDRAGGDRRPWAIRSKLLRKLRSEDYRMRVVDADLDDHVLVVGEPKIDDPRYAPLPGALAEATEVAATLGAVGGVGPERVTALLGGADATTIMNALLARRYRIVHIAGHGEPGALGGLVMSDGTVLGPREIQSMRTVPELVFVNCCHLAARDQRQLLAPLDRAQFAADVADALIRIGVRCVIAAGWAVEDEPARLFATTLYRELLAGRSFIDAVARAREEAWNHADGGNTWAAYQCYGDPSWSLRRAPVDAPPERTSLALEFAGISSPMGLALALEELAVRSRYQDAAPELQRQKLLHLEARFGAVWPGMGALAEAFGVAYAAAGDFDAAIDGYARAVRCNDGSATMRATEQLSHLMVRRAWARSRGGDAATRAAARAEIEAALARLDMLASLEPTAERHSLRGSAWKRLAMLARDDGDAAGAAAALTQLVACYRQAADAALAAGDVDETFPTMNLLTASVAAAGPTARAWRLDPTLLARVREQLQARQATTPDFWSMVGTIELELLEAAAGRRLAASAPALIDAFADLKRRVQAPRMWGSVAENADFVLTPWWASGRRTAEGRAAHEVLEALRAHAAV
ncbi:MAG: CHAT domain-containing protein, partial [Rubrivivax sp.]